MKKKNAGRLIRFGLLILLIVAILAFAFSPQYAVIKKNLEICEKNHYRPHSFTEYRVNPTQDFSVFLSCIQYGGKYGILPVFVSREGLGWSAITPGSGIGHYFDLFESATEVFGSVSEEHARPFSIRDSFVVSVGSVVVISVGDVLLRQIDLEAKDVSDSLGTTPIVISRSCVSIGDSVGQWMGYYDGVTQIKIGGLSGYSLFFVIQDMPDNYSLFLGNQELKWDGGRFLVPPDTAQDVNGDGSR